MTTENVVVINSHGTDKHIGNNGNGLSFPIDAVNKLPRKSIGALILLGCNCGHYATRDSNIARAFCKKVNAGTVIAADGTVMHMIGGSFITFSTKGWYSYKSSNYGSTVTIKKMNEITISISTMLKWCGL